jgi:hypothetical protein
MLAAVPNDESKLLELFNLALHIVCNKRAIPRALSDHFDAVLTQAKSLATDPSSVSGGISPQALQLACRLRQASELRAVVESVSGIATVTPDLASKMLASLEERLAP